MKKVKAWLQAFWLSNGFVAKGFRVATKAFLSALILGLSGWLYSVHSWAPTDLKTALTAIVIAAGAAAFHAAEAYVKTKFQPPVGVKPAPKKRSKAKAKSAPKKKSAPKN